MRYRVTLVLARSREFPFGNSRCFYELLLLLKDDRRLDLEAWSRRSVKRAGRSTARSSKRGTELEA